MARAWMGAENVRVALFEESGDFTVVGKFFGPTLVTIKFWSEHGDITLRGFTERWKSTPDEVTGPFDLEEILLSALPQMYAMMRTLGIANPERWA